MLDSGETALQCQAGVVSGNVSIMTSCSGILQPAIRTFLTENREIHYQQYRYTSELIAAQLEGGTADFAVTTTPISSTKFSWTTLVEDELFAVIPRENPLWHRDSITMEQLRDQPLIISNNLLSIHDVVEEGFSRYGMRPKIAYELNNPPLTQQLLEENRGIAFVPGLEVEPLPDSRGGASLSLQSWDSKAPGSVPAPGGGAAGAVFAGLVRRSRERTEPWGD